MNGDEEEESPRKVNWGTAALKDREREFEGIIREARIQKSDRSFGDKGPQDQLFLLIEPTTTKLAELPEEKWPRHWYSVSYSKKSKWAVLQERLEELGVLPKESEEELVGKKFLFERKDLEFGVNRVTKEKMVAEDVILPKKYLGDSKKKTTSGGKAAAPSPPSEDVKEGKEMKEEVDVESVIVEMVRKEPMDLEKLYVLLGKEYGVKRAEAFKTIVGLQKQKVVKLLKDENKLTMVE